MMKARRRYGNIEVEVEGRDVKDVWRQLAAADECFGDMECAAKIDGVVVSSSKINLKVRTLDSGDEYFEQVCVDHTPEGYKLRGYKKSFGQHKKTPTLYPKNDGKDAPEGSTIGLNGWYKPHFQKKEEADK